MSEERRTEAGGISFRWLESGEGRDVVFIHGIPTSPALWRHVTPRVEGARCLAWEMVGYGLSQAQGEGRDISVKAQAGYLLDWLEAAGVERPILVGHDLGGGVAQIAAVREPGRFAGLVLIDSIGYDSFPIPRMKLIARLGPLVARTPTRLWKLQLASALRQGHSDRARASESFEAHWPGYSGGEGRAAFVRQAKSLHTSDTVEVADDLPGLGLPAEVVWGAKDPFQKVDYAERFALDLKAPLDIVSDGRHFVPEDQPERVAAAVNRLVAGDSAPS